MLFLVDLRRAKRPVTKIAIPSLKSAETNSNVLYRYPLKSSQSAQILRTADCPGPELAARNELGPSVSAATAP